MTKGERVKFDWDEARSLRERGLTYSAIAERLGVSHQAAWYAVNEAKARLKRRSARQAQAWTCESIVDAFLAFAVARGHAPRYSDLGSNGLPHGRTVERKFGSLTAAQLAAGFTPRPAGRPRTNQKEAA